jgi:hypothetical protein
MYTIPSATTAPFSSTSGADECHDSVKGRFIVSLDAPVLEAVFLHMGQSAAKHGVIDRYMPRINVTRITKKLFPIFFVIMQNPPL